MEWRDLPYWKGPDWIDNVGLMKEHENTAVPSLSSVLNPFNSCPFEKTKVVIFCKQPPEEELNSYLGALDFPFGSKGLWEAYEGEFGQRKLPVHDLEKWASQGVLLLNFYQAILDEEEWTDSYGLHEDICEALRDHKQHLCWYTPDRINEYSALDAFFDHDFLTLTQLEEHPFKKINDYLSRNGLEPIDWSL